MSSIKDEELFITFGELKCLEIDEISTCIEKCSALSICEKSSAEPTEIFTIWVRKLFKAYDIAEYTKSEWLEIIAFLEKLLWKFIKNLPTPKDEKLVKQLNLWWSDTLELLKWLETVINHIEVNILAVTLNFILEIIIKTCSITDKSTLKPAITIHQQLLNFLTNHLLKADIQNVEEFNACNKVLLSLCDAAAVISSADVKSSIETWRSSVKFTIKCHNFYKERKGDCQTVGNINALQFDGGEKTINGILYELKKIFQHFLADAVALNNDNFLKVAQFYLKLLRIILQNCEPAKFSVQEYFELYSLCMHQLRNINEIKVTDFLQKDLHDVMHVLYQRTNTEEHLCNHWQNDNKLGERCYLIEDYMAFQRDQGKNSIHQVSTTTRIFDILFDGHLIFAENDIHSKVVLHYAALTAQDATNKLHMKWCNNVMETSWIKSYASYEILVIFYSNFFKNNVEQAFACLEFWIQCWHKFNIKCSTVPEFGPQKRLIELLLKTIVDLQLPEIELKQVYNKFPCPEVLLLKCGQSNLKLHNYLNNNLKKYLKQMQSKNIQRMEYNELINLLDIWLSYPQYVNIPLIKDDLVKAFVNTFSVSLPDILKFVTFFNKTFSLLKQLEFNAIHSEILNCLQENSKNAKAIASVFMLEYLTLKFKQHQIKSLISHEMQKLQKFLNDLENEEMDFKSLWDLYGNEIKTNTNVVINCSKRPRLVTDLNDSSYKLILNQMLEYSRQLRKTTDKFDNHDCGVLNCIKENIEKCLLK